MSYTHPRYFDGYNSQMHTQPFYPPNQPSLSMQNQWQYQPQLFNTSYQPFTFKPPIKKHH